MNLSEDTEHEDSYTGETHSQEQMETRSFSNFRVDSPYNGEAAHVFEREFPFLSIAHALNQETQEDSEDENAPGHSDELLEDVNGNTLSASKLVKMMLEYKKDTQNFFVGNLQKSCNRTNRKPDDRWYPWTKEMMERVDRNENAIKDILKKYSHANIQDLCRRIGGGEWNRPITDRLGNMINEIGAIKKMLMSQTGFETCWGKMKSRGVFMWNVENHKNKIKMKYRKNKLDLYDYAQYKKHLWKAHYKNLKEKDEQNKLYTKFW